MDRGVVSLSGTINHVIRECALEHKPRRKHISVGYKETFPVANSGLGQWITVRDTEFHLHQVHYVLVTSH